MRGIGQIFLQGQKQMLWPQSTGTWTTWGWVSPSSLSSLGPKPVISTSVRVPLVPVHRAKAHVLKSSKKGNHYNEGWHKLVCSSACAHHGKLPALALTGSHILESSSLDQEILLTAS